MTAAQLLLDALAQILEQVEAIGDLSRLWGTLSSALCVESAAVAADDRDLGMLAEPSRGAFGGAIRQHVDDLTPLQVDDQRSVATAFDPGPVVDAHHATCWWRAGAGRRLPLQMPQDGVVADRHAQPGHQAFRWPAAGGVAEQSNQLRHTVRPPCMACRYPRQPVGERLQFAQSVPAPPPRYPDAEPHDRPLRRQILELSDVMAMAGIRPDRTPRGQVAAPSEVAEISQCSSRRETLTSFTEAPGDHCALLFIHTERAVARDEDQAPQSLRRSHEMRDCG